jgi:hypothetical protein
MGARRGAGGVDRVSRLTEPGLARGGQVGRDGRVIVSHRCNHHLPNVGEVPVGGFAGCWCPVGVGAGDVVEFAVDG